MSTIVYRSAKLLIEGTELTGALHDLSMEYSAEMLDETTFGDDTRIRKGGLKMGSISGAGYFDGAIGTEAVLFPNTGTDDVILSIFPDTIVEGGLSSGRGYAMKGVLDKFDMGGKVGELLDIDWSCQSRGIEA